MWLTIIMAVLGFILSKASGASTKKALGAAALVGAGTYLAVENTTWGANASRDVDAFLGVGDKPAGAVGAPAGRVQIGTDEQGNAIYAAGNGSAGATGQTGIGSGLAGLWGTLGPVGQAAVGVGAGVGTASVLDKYGIWILGGVGAYLILKD